MGVLFWPCSSSLRCSLVILFLGTVMGLPRELCPRLAAESLPEMAANHSLYPKSQFSARWTKFRKHKLWKLTLKYNHKDTTWRRGCGPVLCSLRISCDNKWHSPPGWQMPWGHIRFSVTTEQRESLRVTWTPPARLHLPEGKRKSRSLRQVFKVLL